MFKMFLNIKGFIDRDLLIAPIAAVTPQQEMEMWPCEE